MIVCGVKKIRHGLRNIKYFSGTPKISLKINLNGVSASAVAGCLMIICTFGYFFAMSISSLSQINTYVLRP